MKKSVIIILTLSVVLLLVAGGTIAWLTAQDSVTNTFTVGKITISLTEPEWSENNNKIYPGAEIPKNPTVIVKANSENCYVYIIIDNKINEAVANSVTLDIKPEWTLISIDGSKILYRYSGSVSVPNPVSLSTIDQELPPIFTKVKVDVDVVTEDNIGLLDGKTIQIKAFAHQSDAITQAEADANAKSHFTMP